MTATFLADEPLSLPASPTEPAPAAFPVIASLAPLVAAGVIWFVTGSPFVLLFAVLGPVIAVASMVDGRRAARRTRRRDAAAHAVALAQLRTAVSERQSEVRRRRRRETPSASQLLETPDRASRWRSRTAGGIPVVLGSGSAASGIRLEGTGSERELRAWAATLTDAPITADASGGVALVGPAALVRAFARALLVQLAFTLAPDRFALEPVVADRPDDDWAWTGALPHTTGAGGVAHSDPVTAAGPGDRRSTGEAARKVVLLRFTGIPVAGNHAPTVEPPPGHPRVPWLLLAADLVDVPPGCATVVRLHSATRAEVLFLAESEHPESPGNPADHGSLRGSGQLPDFRPEFVTREQALGFARLLRERAATAGLLGGHRALPSRVTRADLAVLARHPLAAVREAAGREGLACAIGVGTNGPVTLDLVGQGPHAVVGGTTGSGKSELLVGWVCQMAEERSPDEVTFLLIDFKGGAAFRPLAALPHCVGLVTDLDGRQAERALASLAAELRHRERVLAAAGARDLAELRALGGPGSPRHEPGKNALPRLVIVVDEFATMLASFPELHALFVDIAARGRSLGVHLVLCTQRPAGVVRDALLANCTLRISLRVNNAADSQAVIGTDSAAAIPAAAPGRSLISWGDGGPEPCQVVVTSAAEIEALAAAAGTAGDGGAVRPLPPRRPWLDPLPARVNLADLDGLPDLGRPDWETHAPDRTPAAEHGFRFGLIDEPDRQRYSVARYGPGDGNVFVLGGARSGKTSVLAVFASQARAAHERFGWPPPDVEAVWDALTEARGWIDRGGAGRVRTDRTGEGRDRRAGRARLLLLDDLDSVCARWEPDHRQAALECLASLLRDGLPLGMHVLITAQRLNGPLQNLAALCQDHLLLRLPDRAEHLAAGGQAAQYDPALPPGGGQWRGRRIQVLAPERAVTGSAVPDGASQVGAVGDRAVTGPESRATATVLGLGAGDSIILVSGSPARAAADLRADAARPDIVELTARAAAVDTEAALARPGAATVFIGDAETWQANWSLLAALRVRAPLVFDGCTLADYRMLTRRRDLPPPVAPGRGHLWSLSPEGRLSRVAFGRT
ncbi:MULTISPECIES: FtsK/SpoIIIE domain-containing protein [unclassified Cryobacterium]|uniref:FtsK/SpoIIIE domain-containing protein n=1 Tax=unclassified Cryobacterium TaxID=2649013 RepID=UPI002AB41972|nr:MULTISPECIES: FtsK/SpoIIIE domain-containing protein [unclassified Cryobacterium]MDY7541034.1 FtsK/SpoIIIE domain-containing protein [Cryobacterium sp. 5B3]MEA9998454.1 FtsK/SpoIIIE domain-containing protein [Cryobacterium sp. RTS3]MEB0265567.1 FtsK/SpoIIIE domain-containing protein [Cryobacterium sp. 10I5]MEB0273915.1 FtsK/SpoIIIE domain-containing protein [Cryobacterium sp. 5B3]